MKNILKSLEVCTEDIKSVGKKVCWDDPSSLQASDLITSKR